jgi:gluconolactonase
MASRPASLVSGTFLFGLICSATYLRAADELVAPGAKIERLATGFQFTEGPAYDAQGNIFFTDIPNARIHKWSLDGKLTTFREDSGGANGLYFDRQGNLLACEGGNRRVTTISPDGKLLYVADPGDGKTYVYRTQPDGSLADRKLAAPVGADGMTLDEKGNLYLARKVVHVFSPGGENVTTIEVPESPSNLCFGAKDRRTLFITARKSLYSIRMSVRGQ